MSTFKHLLQPLLGRGRSATRVDKDDTDSTAAPRLQHPERYDNVDVVGAEAGFPAELGGSWSTGAAPLPAYPRMSRREARRWERLKAQDAERKQQESQ